MPYSVYGNQYPYMYAQGYKQYQLEMVNLVASMFSTPT